MTTEAGHARDPLLFLNPGHGIVGPNVGMAQLGKAALERGHELEVVMPERDEIAEQLTRRGLTCHIVPTVRQFRRGFRPSFVLGNLWREWKAYRHVLGLAHRLQPGCICLNGESMLIPLRVGGKVGCGTVVLMRSLGFVKLGRVGRLWFRLQRRWVTRYIAIAEAVKDALVEFGVPAGKVTVIYNGVDLSLYDSGRPRTGLRDELGLPPEGPVVGTVCHLDPRKGVLHGVRAFARVAREVPEARYVVVGGHSDENQPYADKVMAEAKALGAADQIIFAGRRNDVPELLKLFDVVVHPAETEACPRAVQEALATGRPLVAFDVASLPEFVVQGQTGYVVPPFDTKAMADRVIELLMNPELAEELGRGGRRRAEEMFDLDKANAAMLDVIQEAAKEISSH